MTFDPVTKHLFCRNKLNLLCGHFYRNLSCHDEMGTRIWSLNCRPKVVLVDKVLEISFLATDIFAGEKPVSSFERSPVSACTEESALLKVYFFPTGSFYFGCLFFLIEASKCGKGVCALNASPHVVQVRTATR